MWRASEGLAGFVQGRMGKQNYQAAPGSQQLHCAVALCEMGIPPALRQTGYGFAFFLLVGLARSLQEIKLP